MTVVIRYHWHYDMAWKSLLRMRDFFVKGVDIQDIRSERERSFHYFMMRNMSCASL